MCRRQIQISVMMSTLRLTLSEIHNMPKLAGFPFSRKELARIISTIVMITRTVVHEL